MAKTWYPVVDYLECAECGACIKKCPHGVYDKAKAPSPVVVNPDNCVDHCHGCGNLCPQGAITYVGDDTGWVPPHGKSPEPASSCSCYSEKIGKQIAIDFLYLDLDTCERCITTDSTLDEAVKDITGILDTLGYTLIVKKVNVNTEQLAEKHKFLSSPTIRVNGSDICLEVKENTCKDCGDICGNTVDCRVFVYEGEEYNQPPKAMIIDGILKTIYAPGQLSSADAGYTLPENLKTFYSRKVASCCDSKCSCTEGCK